MSKPVGPYTPAIHAGDFLMISGQVGHVDGILVEGGLDGEAPKGKAATATAERAGLCSSNTEQ